MNSTFTPAQLDEIIEGVDGHLRGLESFVEALRKVRTSFEDIRQFKEQQYLTEIQEVKNELKLLTHSLQEQGLINKNYECEGGFSVIKDILDTEEWPSAVPEKQICNTPERETNRAEIITVLIMSVDFKGLRFLDYGCGKGYVTAAVAAKEAALSVGYDTSPEWEQSTAANLLLTTSPEEAAKRGPYDIILMHDVLDHCEKPLEALSQIRYVCKPNTKVYVRTHPWCSRHGGHLYLQKNKAFLHLILDEIELERMAGLHCQTVSKVFYPMPTYRDWFEKTGFTVKLETPLVSKVEEFFLNHTVVRNRLKKHWNDDVVQMRENMAIDFVDYELEPKTNTILF